MNIGAVPDNRYDDNMRQISESFFNSDFWYRTTINHQPSANKNQHTYLNFDGINWKADILLNGQKIGRIDGAFIRSRIDVTNKLKHGLKQVGGACYQECPLRRGEAEESSEHRFEWW